MRRGPAEVISMTHEQVENGVDGGATVRLGIDLPAWVRRLEKQLGAKVGEEGAAISPVVTAAGRQCFHCGEGVAEKSGVAVVGGGVVGTEATAVFGESVGGGLLGKSFPAGAKEVFRGGVKLRGLAPRGRTKNSHCAASLTMRPS